MGAVVAVLLELDDGKKDVFALPPSAFWLTTARQHTSGVAPCTNQKPRAAATRHDWQ